MGILDTFKAAGGPPYRKTTPPVVLSSGLPQIKPVGRAWRITEFMSRIRLKFNFAALLALSVLHAGGDPLPSWKEGPAKQAILDFVRVTTDQSRLGFIASQDRIATFDGPPGSQATGSIPSRSVGHCIRIGIGYTPVAPTIVSSVPFAPSPSSTTRSSARPRRYFFGVKRRDAELMQYRCPVGSGPSGNRCPR